MTHMVTPGKTICSAAHPRFRHHIAFVENQLNRSDAETASGFFWQQNKPDNEQDNLPFSEKKGHYRGESGFKKAENDWSSIIVLAFLFLFCLPVKAAPLANQFGQFDVFLGYDGFIPEASWFPVVFEVKNDGPAFTGTIEISQNGFSRGESRRLLVELPTGTLKRVVIPVFAAGHFSAQWDARLLDEREHVRAEQTGIQTRRNVPVGIPLIGALPRTPTGLPELQRLTNSDSDLQPAVARLQPAILPDNPLTLEGMDTLYLNTERAGELNERQVNALFCWLNAGGHLIIGIEQISDVNGTPWLRSLVPAKLTDMRGVASNEALQNWLQRADYDSSENLPLRAHLRARKGNSAGNPYAGLQEDRAFEKSDLQVAVGTLRPGTRTLVSAGETPLLISSFQGQGRVTTLMFSPERKPFNDWQNRASFWSKLTGVPPELYTEDRNSITRGGYSIDGVFGAMIDSRQVRKLPVEWLLLLLIVYLVVIGPLDQYWLKRIRRPMLTWITFPCYVVIFSLLIYYIGYKLRAGDTEWNELHLVDVLPRGTGAEFHGSTYASIYSPVNDYYRVENQQQYSNFRDEFLNTWNAGQDNERGEVVQYGDNFKAQIFVPVWTSQLYNSDWWQESELPLKYSVADNDSTWTVTVDNLRDRPLEKIWVVLDQKVFELGNVPAMQKKDFTIEKAKGQNLSDFISVNGRRLLDAANSRQSAFGSTGKAHLGDVAQSSLAVSFVGLMPEDRFITPPGLDMSHLATPGNALLFAWEPGYSPLKPLNQFSSTRGSKNTFWRLVQPLKSQNPPGAL